MNPTERVEIGRTGVQVTRLGLGTGILGAVHDDGPWKAIIDHAWDRGIRLFDTSPYYGFGTSETRLGRQLRERPRDQYTLSTKVGRLLREDAPVDEFAEAVFFPEGRPEGVTVPHAIYDYSHDGALASLRESRERLGIDSIDIVYVHDIIENATGINHKDEAIAGAFPALVELREAGVIRAIGAGVQDNQLVVDIATAVDVDVFLLAGRYTLLDQESLDEALPLCERKGISIVIGSPLNAGILFDPRDDASFDFRPAPPEILAKARAIKAVCDRYCVPLPAAAMQFPYAHPCVAAILTGAENAAQLDENVKLLQHPIPAALWDDLRDEGLIRPDAPTPKGV